MKKSLSLLVAIAMVFSMFAAVASAAEKQSAGEYLQEIGVIKGNLEGNLNEDKEWKREDLTVLLSRLLGVEKAASEHANNHGFTDVTNSFYDGYISWAKAEGLMEGKGNDKFGYNDPLTNQQFAAVVLRALKIEAEYADVPKVAVEKKLVAEDTDFAANALRGVTYEVIVTALNTEVTGTGKKLGTILGLKGFEITELKVASATSPSRNTVVVNFNTEVGALVANNFTVHEKGNEYAINVIDKVAVDGTKVTLTLIDTLVSEKEYVVEVKNAANKAGDFTLEYASQEFTFVAQDPASIGFKATTIAIGDTAPVVIKDAAGNDITANYDLGSAITVETSANGVVDASLKGISEGFSVVNVKLNDTKLETGNTIVNVKVTLSDANSIGRVTLDSGDFANPKTELFKSSANVKVVFEVLDKDGKETTNANLVKSFRSQTPTVAVVDVNTGVISPVKEGTATIVVTGQIGDKKVSKSVTVTVKADPVATSLKVDKSVVRYVINSGIQQDINVEVLDQYGNTFNTTDDIVYTITKGGLVTEYPTANTEVSLGLTAGKAALQFTPGVAANKGSGTLKVKFGKLEKTVSVSLVEGAAFAGYAAVAGDTTLDLTTVNDDNKKGPRSTTVTVYEKDVNGNYIGTVDPLNVELAIADQEIVKQNGTTVEAVKPGTKNVAVKVGSGSKATIANIAFTVVNTESTLTSVSQINNAVTVDLSDADTVLVKLFGTTADGAAFVGYDQYGTKVKIELADVQAFSSNQNVVNKDTLAHTNTEGSATLTLKIADKLYTVTVKVVA